MGDFYLHPWQEPTAELYISRFDPEELRTMRGLEWVDIEIFSGQDEDAIAAELMEWLWEEMYKPKL